MNYIRESILSLQSHGLIIMNKDGVILVNDDFFRLLAPSKSYSSSSLPLSTSTHSIHAVTGTISTKQIEKQQENSNCPIIILPPTEYKRTIKLPGSSSSPSRSSSILNLPPSVATIKVESLILKICKQEKEIKLDDLMKAVKTTIVDDNTIYPLPTQRSGTRMDADSIIAKCLKSLIEKEYLRERWTEVIPASTEASEEVISDETIVIEGENRMEEDASVLPLSNLPSDIPSMTASNDAMEREQVVEIPVEVVDTLVNTPTMEIDQSEETNELTVVNPQILIIEYVP